MNQIYTRFIIFGLLCVYSVHEARTQSKTEWFINININNYFPLNNKENKPYPIFWYGKSVEDKDKLMIGGLGIGVAGTYTLSEKWKLKGNLNFSRRAFYDESFFLIDPTGMVVSTPPVVRSEEYLANVLLTAHYFFSTKISLGVGLGEQTLLSSRSVFQGPFSFVRVSNGFYKPILLTLPVEFSWKLNKFLLAARYEQSLMNRLRGDAEGKNTFGQLFIEIGYSINKTKVN